MKKCPSFRLNSRGLRFAARPLGALVVAAAVMATVSTGRSQILTTIAHYDFTDASNVPSSLFRDSSGNNYNLTFAGSSTGIAQSTNVSPDAPTSVSLSLPQTHGVAYGSVNLSTHTAIEFNWYMQTDATRAADNVIFQLGSNSTVAGFVSIRLVANTVGNPTTFRISQRLSNNNFATADFTLNDPSSWQNYSLTIDNSIIGANRFSLMLNGVEQTASAFVAPSVAGTFFNELRVGAASSTGSPFTGYLQDFYLYSVVPIPEPGTWMLGLAMVGFLVFRRWRRK